MMQPLDDATLVALWERGAPLHPLDRALVLGGAARPDVPAGRLADLPLGEINRALLAVRRAAFGSRLAARVACERCAAALEVALDADALDAGLGTPGAASADPSLRAPTMRDLAAIAGERDADAAAPLLARRCWLGHDSEAPPPEDIERRLEALDPGADIALAVTCETCGQSWHASLDLGAFLWTEVAARAGAVFADVDRLARAYGWTEREVLALSPQRRAAYLEFCPA